MRNLVAVVSLVLILAGINWSIYGKEQHLAHGKVAFLQLAPVDPRSLMQGDYMALRFQIAQEISHQQRPERFGQLVATLDEQNVAHYARRFDGKPLAANELVMNYRVREGRVKFATDAFFFQEGQASLYERARYGLFRVAEDGELLLVSMHDDNLKQLGRSQ